MGVLGVLGPAPQVESKSSGFRWEHDLPVRVPDLSLWHRSQAVRLHCQFVAPRSFPARNGKETLGGERCRSGQWAGTDLAHIGPRFSPPGPFGRTNGEVWHRSDEGPRVSCWCFPGGLAPAAAEW